MSFSLPATVTLPASPPRHNLAIAEIAFYGLALSVQLTVRYLQIRPHGGATALRNSVRDVLRACLNFVVILALIRIAGFAIYLGTQNPNRSLIISEVVLQSVGMSPLLLELSFTLLKCGRAGSSDKRTTVYSKIIVRMLQCARIPVVIAAVLIVVAGSILNLAFIKAGAAMLLATYLYIAGIAILVAIRYRERLIQTAEIAVWLCVATLPLYLVRVIYLMLVEFGDTKFDPILGNWRYLVAMGFAMEAGIVVLLVIAGIAANPWWIDVENSRRLPIATRGKLADFESGAWTDAY